MNADLPAFAGTNMGCGLTKREWFAGMALNGIYQCSTSLEDCAKEAVRIADALLAELEKGKK